MLGGFETKRGGKKRNRKKKREKKKTLWLLSMPSFELKHYNRGIVCIALLQALEVTRRRLWLGVAGARVDGSLLGAGEGYIV